MQGGRASPPAEACSGDEASPGREGVEDPPMPTPGCWGPYKSPPELRPGLSEQPPWARAGRAEPVSLLPGSVIWAGSGSLAQGPCDDLSLRILLALVAPPPRRGTRDTRGRRRERGGSRQGAPLYRRWAAVPVCPLPPRSRCALCFPPCPLVFPSAPRFPPGPPRSLCPRVPPFPQWPLPLCVAQPLAPTGCGMAAPRV